MVEVESQYIIWSDGETVANVKTDDDGLGLIQLEFGDGYGKGRHILTPEQAVAIANMLIRKAKDMEEAANG